MTERCPTCDGPVEGVVTVGPNRHEIDPCGHKATLAVRRAAMDDVRADGGELRCPFCGRSFTHHHDETAETSLQYHLEAKHAEEIEALPDDGRPTCPTCSMPYGINDEPFCPCGTHRPEIREPALVPDGGRELESSGVEQGLQTCSECNEEIHFGLLNIGRVQYTIDRPFISDKEVDKSVAEVGFACGCHQESGALRLRSDANGKIWQYDWPEKWSRYQGTVSQHDDLETDGGRPIEDIAADDGLEPGETPHGNRVHLVDFRSRSALVRGTDGASDKLLCGPVGNYERCDAPENGSGWCDTCLDRFLGYKFDLTDLPEGVSP